MANFCCGNAPSVFIDGKWACSECGGVQGDSQLDFSDALIYGFGYTATNKEEKKCSCGGTKSNTTHSNYCDLYDGMNKK